MIKADDPDPLIAMEIGRSVIWFSKVEHHLRWLTQVLIFDRKPNVEDLQISNSTSWTHTQVLINQIGNRDIIEFLRKRLPELKVDPKITEELERVLRLFSSLNARRNSMFHSLYIIDVETGGVDRGKLKTNKTNGTHFEWEALNVEVIQGFVQELIDCNAQLEGLIAALGNRK